MPGAATGRAVFDAEHPGPERESGDGSIDRVGGRAVGAECDGVGVAAGAGVVCGRSGADERRQRLVDVQRGDGAGSDPRATPSGPEAVSCGFGARIDLRGELCDWLRRLRRRWRAGRDDYAYHGHERNEGCGWWHVHVHCDGDRRHTNQSGTTV